MSLPKTYQKLVAIQPDPDLRKATEVQEAELAPPAAGEVLVKTAYAGVNAADYLMAQGRYLAPTPPPFDMGGEACGTVVAVGEGVEGIKEGDTVLSIGDGGYREYFTTKASRAIPIPQASKEAVLLGVSGLTASIAMDKVGEMTTGETVLVTAAAGGTGNFAVQLAHIAGNHVIGTCGNDEKVDFLKSIGCDRPINYRSENVKDVLKSEYRAGLDIIFESVGGEMFDMAVKALAVKGRMILIGAISEYEQGPQEVTQLRVGWHLMRKSASVRAFWLMHYLRDIPEHLGKLLGLLQEGKLKLPTDPNNFAGVTGALDALDYMYEGKNIGKLVVDFT